MEVWGLGFGVKSSGSCAAPLERECKAKLREPSHSSHEEDSGLRCLRDPSGIL